MGLLAAMNGPDARRRKVEALLARAQAEERAGHPDAARKLYETITRLAPNTAFVNLRQGNLAYTRGELAIAEHFHRTAVRLAPDWVEGYRHLAVCLHDLRKLDEALAVAQKAASLKPDDSHIQAMLGKIARAYGRADIAGPAMERALAALPDDPKLIYSNALYLLTVGRWREAWPGFEARFQGSDRAGLDAPNHPLPHWKGEAPPPDAIIVVVHEQGLGDTLMMLRYHWHLKGRFSRVIYDVPARMHGLMRASLAGAELYDRPKLVQGTAPSYQVASMSLPACFDAEPPSLTRFPYLRADPAMIARWRTRLGDNDQPKIGLLWHAGKVSQMPGRDVPAAHLRPLVMTPGTKWYSLSIQPLPEDFVGLVEDHSAAQPDMHETAGLLANLDLIITVDTAVAHLAAAMGRPVWLLHRYETEWRWGSAQNPSPWYPGVRIFRQDRIDDWGPVLTDVATALPDFVNGLARRRKGEAAHIEGLRAFQAGDLPGAESHMRRALDLAPDMADCYSNLAAVLKQMGQGADRIALYRRALALQPFNASILANLGAAMMEYGPIEEAESLLRRAIAADETRPEGWANLGLVLSRMKRHAEAMPCLDNALRLNPAMGPAFVVAFNDAGNYFYANGDLDKALAAYEQLGRIAPNDVAVHVNLGAVAHSVGNIEQALRHQADAMALDRQQYKLWLNRGASLTYALDRHPVEVKTHFAEMERELAQPQMPSVRATRDRRHDRPLRVGYVSPDFRRHAAAFFACPLLENHTDQVITHCYSLHSIHDDWTARFKAAARGGWVDCHGISDEALAERIRADEIDILVDLAGHTDNNRLLMFTRRPAPIQVTWMGYVTTTGLSALDYRVTHIDADPQGVEAEYAERLIRLTGTMWCYRPLPTMPEVAPSPFLRKGYVSFGAFNRFSKANATVLNAWARILAAVPDSRLYICVPEGSARDRLAAFMHERGVSPERLICYAKVPHETFWALHGEVDIALDPFPFAGGTTSCETLWMGVPIVSCRGTDVSVAHQGQPIPDSFASRFSSRMSYAFLNQVGLGDLVTRTISDYVGTAIALAHNPDRMVTLRKTLRPRMAAAPLTDIKRFVSEMESAYREIWIDWCETGTE